MPAFALGERYHHGEGLLYRADSRVKLLVTILFAFAVTTIPEGHWFAFTAFGMFVAVSIVLPRLPAWLVVRRSLLALPFIAAAIPLIFTRPGDTVFTVPLLEWTASDVGLVAVSSILLKSWLAVLVAVVLTSCTQPVDLIRGLERLRVPRVLASTIFFMYRYLFVIGGEGQRLMRARDSRSAESPIGYRAGGSMSWRARVLGNMVGSLFIRSYERSERIYAAMQARGYDGTVRFADERALVRADWLLLASAVAVLGGSLPMLDFKPHTDLTSNTEYTTSLDTPVAIAIRDLHYAYPNGHAALVGSNLTIRQGERVAVMGPNGAGKSTLLMHLNGILRPRPGQPGCGGAIEVAGLSLNDANVRRIRALVGVVFQNPDDQLFSPTVFDDVAYGPLYMGLPRMEIEGRVRAALAAVDMSGFEERMPHHLSIGQRKRISLATVLVMDPEVLILDEPSAGLDPRARRGLIALLRGLPQTLLASTHDMRLVRDLFDRAIIMQEGRIVVDAPVNEVLRDETLLEEYGLEMP